MVKVPSRADYLLKQLGALSSVLADTELSDEDFFKDVVKIICKAMGFDVGVLYKVSNVIGHYVILEVLIVDDSNRRRKDIFESKRFSVDLEQPEAIYVNEASAYANKSVSAINVPGPGCDLVGQVYLPEDFGGGYLIGGDCHGQEAAIQDYEIQACEIMCNLLSAHFMKTQFEHLAIYDALTGIYNSRMIRNELNKVLQRYQRNADVSSVVVMADIDFFKSINDRYGHIQGDYVLREVGQLIASSTRGAFDLVGRYGGEEFLIVYEGLDEPEAIKSVERLRIKIENHAFQRVGENGLPLGQETLRLTMSFGLACLKAGQEVKKDAALLAMADAALYQAKEEGRNCTICYPSETP